jgi:hypothetical protein
VDDSNLTRRRNEDTPRSPDTGQTSDSFTRNQELDAVSVQPHTTVLSGTKQWLFVILSIIGAVSFLWHSYSAEKKMNHSDERSRTKYLMGTTPLIDGHNDLPYLLRLELKNKIYDSTKFSFREGKTSSIFT